MYITGENIVLFFSVLGGVTVLIGYIFSASRWLQKQEDTKRDIEALRLEIDLIKRHHDDDISAVKREDLLEFKEIKTELQMLTHAVLACLESLYEAEGMNNKDQVKKVINMIRKHMNTKAHE